MHPLQGEAGHCHVKSSNLDLVILLFLNSTAALEDRQFLVGENRAEDFLISNNTQGCESFTNASAPAYPPPIDCRYNVPAIGAVGVYPFAVEPGSFAQSDSEMFTYKGEV